MYYRDIKTGSITQLKQPLGSGGILVVRYPTFDPSKADGATATLTLTLNDAKNNSLISIKQAASKLVLNSKQGPTLGQPEEVQVDWKTHWANHEHWNHSLAVVDHGEHYQVMIDLRSVAMFKKRIEGGVPTKFAVEFGTAYGAPARCDAEAWGSFREFLLRDPME